MDSCAMGQDRHLPTSIAGVRRSTSLSTQPLFVIACIVGISLAVAVVLFGILDSSGTVDSQYAKFGGAAAGFFAAFFPLQRWYNELSAVGEARLEADRLRSQLERFADPPDFRIPAGYLPYRAPEESVAFCYPQNWRHEPQKMDLIFAQRPEQLPAGDRFRRNLNVLVIPTVTRVFALRDAYRLAERLGLDERETERRCGIALAPGTEHLPVDVRRMLNVLGIHEEEFADEIYELEAQLTSLLMGARDVRRSTVFVDGVRSHLMTYSAELDPDVGTLWFLQVLTYVAERDVTFVFTFTDDLSDRDELETVAQEVLGTVRFWSSARSTQSLASA